MHRWHPSRFDLSRRNGLKGLAQPSLKNVIALVRHDNSFRSVANA
jgi:hypothetical protein